MTRQTLDREIDRLKADILALGSMVEEALLRSVNYLKARDLDGSRRLIAEDERINAKRFAIEADALAVIATQSPMARDLRVLAAVLEIATELERTGDYAKGISKINLLIGDRELIKPLVDIPLMLDKALDMLRRALQAFVDENTEVARALPAEDDQVDALYNRVYQDLIRSIMDDPTTLDQATLLMWAAHNLERAADRVTNICERIVFSVTGEMKELDSH